MKKIRKRLTYANVMSSIAVFLVLGGASAFAASHLGKNSVGSKQLKKNAVTTQKIKNGAVTAAKMNVAGLPKVPSASTADTANTANNAAHANTANNAAHANTADNATHANNADDAGNANTVDGNAVRKLFYSSGSTTSKTTILSLNGLTLKASCEGGTPQLWATTSVADAVIHATGTVAGTPFYVERDSWETTEELNLIEQSDSVEGNMTYATPGGAVVSADFLSEEGAFLNFETDCVLAGHAIG